MWWFIVFDMISVLCTYEITTLHFVNGARRLRCCGHLALRDPPHHWFIGNSLATVRGERKIKLLHNVCNICKMDYFPVLDTRLFVSFLVRLPCKCRNNWAREWLIWTSACWTTRENKEIHLRNFLSCKTLSIAILHFTALVHFSYCLASTRTSRTTCSSLWSMYSPSVGAQWRCSSWFRCRT